ncbi:uncharacterized protein LTR77_006807 [Saxophila tyrrhenica]|uniref:Uncharacterized protein n=1 Tax=Saxophila tyrrhenica TaxID=1690608 RepID=A0AAV9P8R3_9PEZI|nr:hypothetical protein LTR77_006807 [Saxophila tyrrhenica]
MSQSLSSNNASDSPGVSSGAAKGFTQLADVAPTLGTSKALPAALKANLDRELALLANNPRLLNMPPEHPEKIASAKLPLGIELPSKTKQELLLGCSTIDMTRRWVPRT